MSYLLLLVYSIGISSKLDFGNDNEKPKSFVIKEDGSSRYKIVENERKSDFDSIGVVCVSGNCNKTNDESNGGVSTDVVVHVRTNVNISGTNNTKEEVPDVPVVAGYGSSGVHNIVNNDFDRPTTYNTRPEVMTTPQFVPINPEIINIPSPSVNYRHNRPVYHPRTDPRNHKNVGFQSNNVEIQIPHRPHYINHYYGEHPPPQLIWYQNGRSTYNPLEFKRLNTVQSNGFNWNNIRSLTTNQLPITTRTTCTCNDGTTYYPTTQQYHVHKRTTDIQIDDKLNPLN